MEGETTDCKDSPASPPAVRRFLDALFAGLDEAGVRYCVSRNFEGLPERVGKDVDLLVAPGEVNAAERCVLGAIESSDWTLISRPKRFGWRSYRLAHAADATFFHVDLVDRLAWRGVRWMDERSALTNRRAHRGLFIPDPAAQGVILLWKDFAQTAAIRAAYQPRIRDAARADPRAFRAYLTWGLGARLAGVVMEAIETEDWDRLERDCGRFRRGFLLRAVRRNPIEPLWGGARFLWGHLRAFLGRPTGIFLVLIGPDGSGKTTVARAVGASLERLFARQEFYHARLGRLPEIKAYRNAFLRLAGRKPPPPPDPASPHTHDRPPHGLARSLVHVLYYGLDHFLAHWKVRRLRARGDLIALDRYFYDWFVQDYYRRTPRWLLPVLQAVLPRPDLVAYPRSRPEVIHARKPELTVEQIARQGQRFEQLVNNMANAMTVSTDSSVDETAGAICARIVQIMAERSRGGRA